jgi:hypothetical protein
MFFIGRPYKKLSADLMDIDRKQCRLVTWLLTSHRILKVHGPLGKRQVQKCGQEEECSYHTFCQCSALAG